MDKSGKNVIIENLRILKDSCVNSELYFLSLDKIGKDTLFKAVETEEADPRSNFLA